MRSAVAAAVALVALAAAPAVAKEGERAPELEVKDAAGKAVKLSSFAGQVVVVDFWASFCEPCKEELPGLEVLARKYRDGKKKVVFLAVNLDKKRAAADRFLATVKLPSLRLLFDADNRSGQRSTLPALWVIDAAGVVRWETTAVEKDTLARLAKTVDAALKQR